MNKRHILTISLLIPLLLLVTVTPVLAKCSISLTYDLFNSATGTYVATDKDYVDWMAKVYVAVTWNATGTGGEISVNFCDVTEDTQNLVVGLKLFDTTAFNVVIKVGADFIKIYDGTFEPDTKTWDKDKPIVLRYKDNHLWVGTSGDIGKYVDEYYYKDCTLRSVNAYGGATDILDSGYIKVAVDKPTGLFGIGTMMTEWFSIILPIVVMVALFGLVLGYIKKMGK